ncbi:putative integrase [Sphingomonas sp. SKA58]|nr:putative integrase [Sphingomonas sp. SKA58]
MVSCMVSKAPYGRADTMGKLFTTTVTSARPREREYKLTDGAGLYLLVKPNGRKLWRLNYAYLGKQRTLSFGAWPDVGLADARERRDEARKLIAAGLDPSHEAKLAEARAMLSEETASSWSPRNGSPSRNARACRRSRSARSAGCSPRPIPGSAAVR